MDACRLYSCTRCLSAGLRLRRYLRGPLRGPLLIFRIAPMSLTISVRGLRWWTSRSNQLGASTPEGYRRPTQPAQPLGHHPSVILSQIAPPCRLGGPGFASVAWIGCCGEKARVRASRWSAPARLRERGTGAFPSLRRAGAAASQEYHTENRPNNTFANGGFFIVRNTAEGAGTRKVSHDADTRDAMHRGRQRQQTPPMH